MKTQFDKSVEWLRPFFESAKGLIPLHKVERVRGFRVPLDKVPQFEARIMTNDHKHYTITLRTHSAQVESQGNQNFITTRHTRRLACDLLVAFAHELAHVKEWEHTPEHWELENKISARFRKLLRKMEVKDVAVRKIFKAVV